MIYFHGSRGTVVHLFADAKADVVDGATIIGWPEGQKMGAGSDVYTGDFHLGIYLSDGTWSWDDGDDASAASLSLNKPLLGGTLEKQIVDPEEPIEEIEE